MLEQSGIMDPIKEESIEPVEQSPSPKEKGAPTNQYYEELLSLLSKLESPDQKLQYTIDFMESTLAQSGTPLFKRFWEARKICIELFKENLSPMVRSELWLKYGDLTKQARALKEILDEQSSFAVEQIEIAIRGLEEDIERIQNKVSADIAADHSPFPKCLENKRDEFLQTQHELNLLNAAASRINALRKELIKTEMRIRQKNKFFQRLSSVGDQVFPRRKDLIKTISGLFQSDVDAFIAHHFSSKEPSLPLHVLREEIKMLQSFAKSLTLNTQSFTATRLSLSQCWDKVKDQEKEKKKIQAHKKAIFQENALQLMAAIGSLNETLAQENFSLEEASKTCDHINQQIRNSELGRSDVTALKDELQKCRAIIGAHRQKQEDHRQQLKLEKDRQERQKFLELRDEVAAVITEAHSLQADQLLEKRDLLKERVKNASLTKVQRMEIEPLFRQINDTITHKQEQNLLLLTDDERQMMDNLKSVLHQRMDRRREIKEQLDSLRKAANTSGLDFSQSMTLSSQIEEERERFDKASDAIIEIENRIQELKKKSH